MENGDDWRATLARIHEKYPYSRFGTNCPMVSNHAIILLALLHGKGDFSRSLMIANTAGYDTDCNSGNVGCILGVLHGLAGLESGPTDWRGPVADRLFLPTADGGRAITDALRETYEIVNSARALQALPPLRPKGGARFHFSLPGSVQGWQGDGLTVHHDAARLALRLESRGRGEQARQPLPHRRRWKRRIRDDGLADTVPRASGESFCARDGGDCVCASLCQDVRGG